jgi:hypothetical protein
MKKSVSQPATLGGIQSAAVERERISERKLKHELLNLAVTLIHVSSLMPGGCANRLNGNSVH